MEIKTKTLTSKSTPLFSELLRTKRIGLGWDRKQMAEALGMQVRMYEKYENGEFDETYSIRREKYIRKLTELENEDFPKSDLKQNESNVSKGNIIFVPLHAYGGFLGGYRSTIFIESLEHFRLPGIIGEHYAFEIGGMSMYKVGDDRSASPGDIAISRPLEELKHMLKGRGYILQTIDGLIYKIFDAFKGERAIFHSLNEDYEGHELPLKEIKKAYFVNFILKKTT